MATVMPLAARVTVSGTAFTSETWANVFHVNIGTETFGATKADSIMDRFSAYYNEIKGTRTNQWKVTDITIRDLRTEDSETFARSITTITGPGVAAALPPQIAMVVSLRTPVNSRRGRGRTYLNGFQAAALTTSTAQFSSATLGSEADDFKLLCDWLHDDGTALAVASFTAGTLYKVTRFNIDSIPDTQRRRVRDLVPLNNVVRDVVDT